MTELYVGIRDGYVAGEVQLVRAKFRGGYRMPQYIKPVDGVDRSPAERNRKLSELAALIPGIVRTDN